MSTDLPATLELAHLAGEALAALEAYDLVTARAILRTLAEVQPEGDGEVL